MNEIVQMISSVGFPIVVCVIMFKYTYDLNTQHKEETEKFTDALNRNFLDRIGKLATAVIAFMRVSLGVFVRKNAAHCFHNGGIGKVFAGNHFEMVALTV